ncbi:DsbA family protein [uncultured Megasphaera sp.]|uniref:DsbA family protein n=1 Tax=Megasphaera massiliensis TaxID=1232428 RepID=UPI00266B4BDD|nr:DsbA family protein [uncultured Megasphaera sp.]
MEKIILTTFTDPMMGLSYEQEPVYEKLVAHFGDRLIFHYVMSGLVRDVSDFMVPEERALPAEEGIRLYNRRLAQIYKEEEAIGGLPINMDGFHLFDADHRSSYPLCMAYKAAELCCPEKAFAFLLKLRRATIVETRQTTKTDELISVAAEAGLDQEQFRIFFEDGRTSAAFQKDLALTQSLGIRQLPTVLIEGRDKRLLVSGMASYDAFVNLDRQAESLSTAKRRCTAFRAALFSCSAPAAAIG